MMNMTNMTVWKFGDPEGAQRSLDKLSELEKERLLNVVEAATVSWPKGMKHPITQHATNHKGLGALDGAFWGLLFGLMFFAPIVGVAVGAIYGVLSGALKEYGIEETFVSRVRAEVTEGTSALFLLTTDEEADRLGRAFQDVSTRLVKSNLSDEQEARLRESFATS